MAQVCYSDLSKQNHRVLYGAKVYARSRESSSDGGFCTADKYTNTSMDDNPHPWGGPTFDQLPEFFKDEIQSEARFNFSKNPMYASPAARAGQLVTITFPDKIPGRRRPDIVTREDKKSADMWEARAPPRHTLPTNRDHATRLATFTQDIACISSRRQRNEGTQLTLCATECRPSACLFNGDGPGLHSEADEEETDFRLMFVRMAELRLKK